MSFLYRASMHSSRAARSHRVTPSRLFSMSPSNLSANLDSNNISKIAEAEKQITGQDNPVRGGPTAQAQSHAGQPINSEALRDITEGEKKITGQDRPVKGGPTAAAQSILNGVCLIQHLNCMALYANQS